MSEPADRSGRVAFAAGADTSRMITMLRLALAEAPAEFAYWHDLAMALWTAGGHREAARAIARAGWTGYNPEPKPPVRSAVIPVLDYSPHSSWDIVSLLADLRDFDGEVICVFNGKEVFEDLRDHPRIDKFSFNKHNVGVARSWNIGLNQAEGDVIFILNADLHVSLPALAELERHLLALPNALAVGIGGDLMDFERLLSRARNPAGSFAAPMVVDKPSGHAFALHARRLHDAGISFDPRLSPYFYEELDLALKARSAGFEVYAAPVAGIEHVDGVSRSHRPIHYLGRLADRTRILIRNANLILDRKGSRD
jgi:glycosyltransferase involved in cell wall biosynthesis